MTCELETLRGDPDLIEALRAVISAMAADADAADLLIGADDDPVAALKDQLVVVERDHLDEREHHFAGLASFGAATPTRCHACGAVLKTRFGRRGWTHPRSDCPSAGNPRPADRRASADITVYVAPEYEPVVRRCGADLHVRLASHREFSGVNLVVAIPVAAAARWAIRLASAVGRCLTTSERDHG